MPFRVLLPILREVISQLEKLAAEHRQPTHVSGCEIALSLQEEDILKVCRGVYLTGKVIAARLKRPYNSHLKRQLRRLLTLGKLTHPPRKGGYHTV